MCPFWQILWALPRFRQAGTERASAPAVFFIRTGRFEGFARPRRGHAAFPPKAAAGGSVPDVGKPFFSLLLWEKKRKAA